MQLFVPDKKLYEPFLKLAKDYSQHGEERYQAQKGISPADFENFVDLLIKNSQGKELKSGRVPETLYWLTDGTNIAGVTGVRHYILPKNCLR